MKEWTESENYLDHNHRYMHSIPHAMKSLNLFSIVVLLSLALKLDVKAQNTSNIPQLKIEAEQGDPIAQGKLGLSYFYGHGVAKDEVDGLKWMRQAAAQGELRAQSFLGHCYLTGKGVAKDEVEGLKWTRQAAVQGEARALFVLGVSYRAGRGVGKDLVEAYAYFNLAGSCIEDARTERDLLEKTMSASQIAEGQRRTKELHSYIGSRPVK